MKQERILILEDDVIAQLTLKKYLQKLGYLNVTVVDNGLDALKEVAKHKYDLCFVDIIVEGDMDGIDTAHAINQTSETPVIYVTASSDRENFNRATETRHYGFIIKPYDQAVLKENIERALQAKSEFAKIQKTEAEHMLDLIYDSADIGMCVTDKNRKFVKVNRAYCRTYGYSESELIGYEFTKVLPEEIKEYAGDLHDRFIAEETDESAGEWKVKCKDGTIKDIYVTAARMKTRDKKVFKVTTVTDITEKKRYTIKLEKTLEEKEQFVREVHHRVKNNLNIISGLLFMQAEKVEHMPEVYKLFLESMNRIRTLSFIHERLYKRDNLAYIDFKDYAQNLAENVFNTFKDKHNNLQLEIDLDPIEMDIDKSISCGLIINEVLSNSFKYAFPNQKEGKIFLSMKKVKGQKGKAEIKMKISDNGIGLPPDFNIEKSNTLGMQLIHNLARQLRGQLTIDRNGGTTFLLTLSLDS